MQRAFLVLGLLLAFVVPAPAQTTKLGVVLMHGKDGRPDFAIVQLAGQLEKAGFLVERPVVAASTQRARALIAAGHGDDKGTFDDSNTGPRGTVTIQVRATPNIFVSFTDMSGPANLVADAAALKAPVLWVSGTADPSQLPRAAGFDRVPANPLNRYLQIAAGHMDTPDAAASAVVGWLKELAGPP